MLKKGLRAVGVLILLVLVGLGGYVGMQVTAFDRSMAEVHNIPIPDCKRSADPQVVARGKHVSDALAACSVRDCHGPDLGGGRALDAGPLGVFAAPNVTLVAQAYSDGELARLLRYGVKKDGRSLRFMPVQDFAWLADADLIALVSYIRSLPVVDRPAGVMKVGILA
jgi:hypothetical protein